MSDPLNNMKYTQFVRQAKGLGIDDLHVSRGEKKDKVVLKYHGIARNKTRVNGEWAIPRKDEADEPLEHDGRRAGEMQEVERDARSRAVPLLPCPPAKSPHLPLDAPRPLLYLHAMGSPVPPAPSARRAFAAAPD